MTRAADRTVSVRLAVAGLVVASAALAGVAFGPTASGTVGPPWGIRLSFVDDPSTTVTATWMTDGIQDPGTVVEYGPSCDALDRQVDGSSSQLTLAPDLRVHEATMTGLEPGKNVSYRVGGDSGFSDCYTTHTAPETGPVRFAVYGDQGVSDGARAVHDRIAADLDDLDLVLIAGDLTYAEGRQSVWNEWLRMNQDVFARVPMMSAPGNHEANTPIGTGDYQEHVAQPGTELYYSFDYANVHVLVVQSDVHQARQEDVLVDQAAFVEEDLRDAWRAKQDGEIDHIVVLQHHPLYSNTEGRSANPDLAAIEEQWFHRYDVELLLTGDNHNYERSHPMAYQVPTDTDGPRYEDPVGWVQLISGGGGRSLYAFREDVPAAPYSAERRRAFHYTTLTVDGGTVVGEAVQAAAADVGQAGDVFDRFELVDTDGPAEPPVAARPSPTGFG